MTARFLLHLREWDHRISNAVTDQWNTHGGGNHGAASAIQFKRSEPRATQWTVNDVLGDDPLLKPVVLEENSQDMPSSSASLSRTGQ